MIEIAQEFENEDGWSDWIHPLPGYLLQCCDCGLVHRMEFEIVPRFDAEPLNPGEDQDRVVVFRASRHAQGIVTPSGGETRSGSVERSEIEPGPKDAPDLTPPSPDIR